MKEKRRDHSSPMIMTLYSQRLLLATLCHRVTGTKSRLPALTVSQDQHCVFCEACQRIDLSAASASLVQNKRGPNLKWGL